VLGIIGKREKRTVAGDSNEGRYLEPRDLHQGRAASRGSDVEPGFRLEGSELNEPRLARLQRARIRVHLHWPDSNRDTPRTASVTILP